MDSTFLTDSSAAQPVPVLPAAPDSMTAPLKGHLLVGAHTLMKWKCRHAGLKIDEMQWILPHVQLRLHAITVPLRSGFGIVDLNTLALSPLLLNIFIRNIVHG